MLIKLGVNPAAYVWVHAQNEKDTNAIAQLAMFGIWIEFDGINPKTLDLHLKAVEALTGQGHLSKILISQDSGWYRVGEPGGGQFNPYSYLFTDFVPALRKRGFQKDQIKLLLVDNPAKALSPLN
jgi:phosphotriesterase-related protein